MHRARSYLKALVFRAAHRAQKRKEAFFCFYPAHSSDQAESGASFAVFFRAGVKYEADEFK